MRIPLLAKFAATILFAAANLVLPQTSPPQPKAVGYLKPNELPDMLRILPPAPTPGDARDKNDRAIFLATRFNEGSPRWSIAQSDADTSVSSTLKIFSCAAGLGLTDKNAPRLGALLAKMIVDTGASTQSTKEYYRRKRPYLIDEGPICLPRSDGLARSPDYPSGHATWGWAVGLILAEIEPDRATPILVRAWAVGESRIVCGVHNASAVEAGRTGAAAVVAVLHSSPAFNEDLAAAKAEVALLHTASPPPETCATEDAALAKRSR